MPRTPDQKQPRKRRGKTPAEDLKDKLEDLPFVGTVTISHGISAEDAIRPPRDMFPEGPEGDEMWLNFDEGEFDGRYEDEN